MRTKSAKLLDSGTDHLDTFALSIVTCIPVMGLRIDQLRAIVTADLTSLSALAIVTGVTEKRIASILDHSSAPSAGELKALEAILNRYERGVRVANAEMARDRFSRCEIGLSS